MVIVALCMLTIYYCFCMKKQSEYIETYIGDDIQFVKDASKDKTMEDVSTYYSGIKVMTQEKFAQQQCGKLGDTIYFVQDNHNSMSLMVSSVTVKEALSEREFKMVEEAVAMDTGDLSNWNCFLQYNGDNLKSVSRNDIESISKYVFVDIQVENLNQIELFMYLKEFKLLVAKQNKMWDKEFYSTRKESLMPYGMDCINSVLISSDKPIEYVKIWNQSNGTIKYDRELDRTKATIKDAFFVDDTMNLRLMFVATDEEIETGILSLCSYRGNASQNGGQFTNQGFVIELGEEIKNAADNQSGDE